MPGQKRDPSRVVRGCVNRGMGEEGGCWLRRIGGLENWPCPGVEPGEGPRAGARHGLLGCARVGVRRRAEVFAIERTPLVWRGEGEEVAVGAPGTKCRRVASWNPPRTRGGGRRVRPRGPEGTVRSLAQERRCRFRGGIGSPIGCQIEYRRLNLRGSWQQGHSTPYNTLIHQSRLQRIHPSGRRNCCQRLCSRAEAYR